MSTFITIAGLQRLTDRELDILHRCVLDRLAGHAEGIAERREALATLSVMRRVIARRKTAKPGF